jgi:hypothetical protein
MGRTWSMCFGLVILANVLPGCATVACDLDDPKFGKDCYECTRKATLEAKNVDRDTGNRDSMKDRINERTEECLRERGYIKQKQEDRPSLPQSMGY